MPNTHHKSNNQSARHKSKAQHGRVIDLRPLVAGHAVRKASERVAHSGAYLRHANSVLRKAFTEFVQPDVEAEMHKERARARTTERTQQTRDRARLFFAQTSQRLVRLSNSRRSIFTHTVYSTFAFACVALLVVIPMSVSALVKQTSDLKDTLTSSAFEGVDSMIAASNSLQQLSFGEASTRFDAARTAFIDTEHTFQENGNILISVASVLPLSGKAIDDGHGILRAGIELSSAGKSIAAVLDQLTASTQAGSLELIPVLQSVHSTLADANVHVKNATRLLTSVRTSTIPQEYAALFERVRDALPLLESNIASIQSLNETLLAIAGNTGEKTYLVLFQNNHEMRPTGGFIGSVAIVYVHNGVVESVDVPPGGIYDIAGQFDLSIAAPEPLQLVTPYWNIQDANWFPHFPTSAQKVEWFYSKVSDDPIDGIFTFTPQVIEDLLGVTGPIDLMAEYGVTITQDNFYQEVQTRAEQKYDVTRESKKIIGDLSAQMLSALTGRLNSTQDLVKIAEILRDALNQKQILAYMTDPVLEDTISAFDWGGEMKETGRDYLAVIHSNIRGGKTDGNIERTVEHSATIQDDGTIIDTVALTHTHLDVATEDYANSVNRDYVRFYVPEGSVLVSAVGFENPSEDLFFRPDDSIPEDVDLESVQGKVTTDPRTQLRTNVEFGKTVFGGWIQTPVGETTTVVISYRLPVRIAIGTSQDDVDHYSLLVQKQPGNFADKDTLKTSLSIPSTWSVLYRTSELYGNNTSISMITDQLFGVVLSLAQ